MLSRLPKKEDKMGEPITPAEGDATHQEDVAHVDINQKTNDEKTGAVAKAIEDARQDNPKHPEEVLAQVANDDLAPFDIEVTDDENNTDDIDTEYTPQRDWYPPEGTPAHDIAIGELSLDTVEIGDSAGMFRLITDAYFSKKTDEEREIVDRRVQALQERDDRPITGEPRATVAIPVAIHNERPDNIRRTLDVVANQRGIDQDEILVYGNMPVGLPEAERREARAAFDKMITEFREAHPTITIRTLAEEYPDDTLSITQVRNDMVDLIARDGAQRGFRFDHPVIMFDADTLHISRVTNETLAGALNSPNSREIIANAFSFYQFDKSSTTLDLEDISALDDAKRLAIVAELSYRSGIHEEIRKYGRPPYIHPQESGMAFALGPVIMVGNFGERGETDNESNRLIMNGLQPAEPELRQALKRAKPEVVDTILTLPEYHRRAIVTTSPRRWEKILQEWVTLPDGADDSTYADIISYWRYSGPSAEYKNFSHTDDVRDSVPEGQYNAPNEERIQRIIDTMFGGDGRDMLVPHKDLALLLKRYNLPLPTSYDSWKSHEPTND